MGRTVERNDAAGRRSIWYAQPAPALAPYITAYDAYTVGMMGDARHQDMFPPAWGAIRLTLRGDYSVQLRRWRYDPMPSAALFGPLSYLGTSHAAQAHAVCVGLTPMGWARFMRLDARSHANRVTPLGAVWPRHAASLVAAASGTDDHAAAFDAFFLSLLDATEPEEEAIGRLFPLLLDPTVLTFEHLLERLEITPSRLRRVAVQHFGFAPKLLLRRARFMRALVTLLRAPRGQWKPLIAAAGYYDQSHFVRDCQLFLEGTLTQFLARPKQLFDASLDLRAAVLGAPAQVLHEVDVAA
jgi:hypothetical protein